MTDTPGLPGTCHSAKSKEVVVFYSSNNNWIITDIMIAWKEKQDKGEKSFIYETILNCDWKSDFKYCFLTIDN